MWNSDIEGALKEKQKSNLVHLQSKSEIACEVYKEKRKMAKKVIRCTYNESWDKFISNIEHDIHVQASVAYKIMKNINKSEKDTEKLR